MADKSYMISLQFTADTNAAKREIESLQASMTKLATGTNIRPADMAFNQGIKDAVKDAQTLKIALDQAFNTKTGKLDLRSFSKSLMDSGKTLEQYRVSMNSLGQEGTQAFNSMCNSIMSAEVPLKKTNSLITGMVDNLKKTIGWTIASDAIHGVQKAISGAYNYAQDLNRSLNDIRIVTGESSEQMAEFAKYANKAAKELSTTTNAYAKGALIYYQQGDSDEVVKQKTDITMKMANVTQESATVVSDQLTAVWNNFAKGSDNLEHFADVMVRLGADTASSSDEIAQGLEKFAATADTVGLSYENAAAALATVTATTRQSADVVGTAFKTIFARLEGLNLGETLDDGTTLNKYSEALQKVGVEIKDVVSGEMKSMDQILEETGAKWKTLTQDQQIALAQTVAGTRQYTQFIALMKNYDMYENLTESAKNATGALQEQQDIYAESWQAAADRVKASWEDVYTKIIDDDAMIKLTDLSAKLVDTLGVVIDSFGGIGGVLTVIGSIAATKLQPQMINAFESMIARGQDWLGITKANTEALREQAAVSMQKQATDVNGGSNTLLGQAYQKQADFMRDVISKSDELSETDRKRVEIIGDMNSQLIKQQELLDQQVQTSRELLDAETARGRNDFKFGKAGPRVKQNVLDTITPNDTISTLRSWSVEDPSGMFKDYAGSSDIKNLSDFAGQNGELKTILSGFGPEVQEARRALADLADSGNASLEELANGWQRVIDAMQFEIDLQTMSDEEYAKQATSLQLMQQEASKVTSLIDAVSGKEKIFTQADIDRINDEFEKIQQNLEGTAAKIKDLPKLELVDGKVTEKSLNSLKDAMVKSFSSAKIVDWASFEKAVANGSIAADDLVDKLGMTQERAKAIAQAATETGKIEVEQLFNLGNIQDKLVPEKISTQLSGLASAATRVGMSLGTVAMSVKGVADAWSDGELTITDFTSALFALINAMSLLNAVQDIRSKKLNLDIIKTKLLSGATLENAISEGIFGAAAGTVNQIQDKGIKGKILGIAISKLSKNAAVQEAMSKLQSANAISKEEKAQLALNVQKAIGKALTLETVAAIGILIAVIAALGAIIWVAVKAYQAQNEQQKNLEEMAETQSQKIQKLASDYSNLKSKIEELDGLEKELDSLATGTEEWTIKVLELNAAVQALVDEVPYLKKFLTIDENGIFRLDSKGLEEYGKQIQFGQKASQAQQAAIAVLDFKNTYNHGLPEDENFSYKEAGKPYRRQLDSEQIGELLDLKERNQRDLNLEDLKDYLSTQALPNMIKEDSSKFLSYINNYEDKDFNVKQNQKYDNLIFSQNSLENAGAYTNIYKNLKRYQLDNNTEGFVVKDSSGKEYAKENTQEIQNATKDIIKATLPQYQDTILNTEGKENFYVTSQNEKTGKTQYLNESTGEFVDKKENATQYNTSNMYDTIAMQQAAQLTKNDYESGKQIKATLDNAFKKYDLDYLKEYGIDSIVSSVSGQTRNSAINKYLTPDMITDYYSEVNPLASDIMKAKSNIDQIGALTQQQSDNDWWSQKAIKSAMQSAYDDAKTQADYQGLANIDAAEFKFDENSDKTVEEQAKQFVKNAQTAAQEQLDEEALEFQLKLGKEEGLDEDELKDLTEYLLETNEAYKNNAAAAAADARQIMKVNDAMEDLNKNGKDWLKTLKDTTANEEDRSKALSGLRKNVSKLINVEEDAIDAQFLQDNSELITKAYEQGGEYIDQLKAKISEQAVIDIKARLDTDDQTQFDSLWNDLQTKLDEYGDLEAGMSIDDSGFYETLNQLIEAAGLTVADVEKLFANTEYSPTFLEETEELPPAEESYPTAYPDVTYEPYTVKGTGNALMDWMTGIATATLSLPKVTYKKGDPVKTTGDGGSVTLGAIGSKDKPAKIDKIVKKSPATGGKPPSGGGSSGSNKGGGGGSSSKPKTKTASQEIERYHTIDKQIDTLSKQMDKYSKAKDRAFGKDKLNAMDQEIAKNQELIGTYERRQKLIDSNLAKDKAAVSAYGFKFDKDGNFTEGSYNAVYKKQIDEYNKLAKTDQEKADENWEKFTSAVSQYEETLTESIENAANKIEAVAQDPTLRLEKVNEAIQQKLGVYERSMELLDWQIEKLGDTAYSQASKLATLTQQNSIISKQRTANMAGVRDTLNEAIGEKGLKEFDDLVAKGATTDQFKSFAKKYELTTDTVDQMLEYSSGLMENMQQTYDNINQAIELYGEAFTEGAENLDKAVEKFDHIGSMLDSYENIIDLLNENNHEAKVSILEAKKINSDNALAASKIRYNTEASNVATLEKKIENAREKAKDPNKKDFYEYELNQLETQLEEAKNTLAEAEEDMASKWEETLELAAEIFEEKVSLISQNFWQTMGVNDADAYQEQFDKQKRLDELYIKDYNKIYEISKLNREINKSLDTDLSVKNKQKLLDLEQEITQASQERAEWTEYDVGYYQKKMSLYQAQIALEEAQNAKTQVRMVRNASGGFGYVYTADENKVEEARQKVEDAQRDLMNYQDEQVMGVQEKWLQFQQDTIDRLSELNQQDADYEQKRAEIEAEYYNTMKYYQDQLDLMMKNSSDLQVELNDTIFGSSKDLITDMSEIFIPGMRDNYKDAKELAQDYLTAMGIGPDGKELDTGVFPELKKAQTDYLETVEDSNEEMLGDKKGSVSSVINYMTKAIGDDKSGLIKQSKDFTSTMTTLGEAVKSAFKDADIEFGKFNGSLSTKLPTMITETEKFVQSLNNLIEAETKWSTTSSGSSKSGSNNNSSSSGSSKSSSGNKNDTKKEDTSKYPKVSQTSGLLQIGSSGDAVKTLQKALNQYQKAGLTVDGEFGSLTAAAVKTFQTNQGIAADGIVGNDTRKKFEKLGYDTGGYTGSWGHEGKLAFLHQKELVLNADDTKNFLAGVQILRDITKSIELQAMGNQFASTDFRFSPFNKTDTLEQNVHITAEFPNAVDHTEIEKAFENLVNVASQYAHRN